MRQLADTPLSEASYGVEHLDSEPVKPVRDAEQPGR